MINEQNKSLVAKEHKQSNISFCFEVSGGEGVLENYNCTKSYTVFFVTKRKTSKKIMSYEELKVELNRIDKVKMVVIQFKKNQRKYIHNIFGEISREKGICSPIIELDDSILFFPELRYSDLGLLTFLFEQNINIKDYNLFMSSGNLIGGRYV